MELLIVVLGIACILFWRKLSSANKRIAQVLTEKDNAAYAARKAAAEEINQAQSKIAKYEEALRLVRDKAKEDALIFAESIADFVRSKNKDITPVSSMMDELEAEYGFSKPGKALAAARKNSVAMIKQGIAAVYKGDDEKLGDTACLFVVDVFNRRFDSIAEKATYDNYSSIMQQIREAYETINAQCRALLNTSITKEYYQARTKEIKAQNVVLGLRERDRAEQQEIREQMRDEEKARREAAKMLRESAKRKADEQKKEAELEERIRLATGLEKEKYEALLAEQRAKLKEYEDRELQAKSLAEFTKRGHVYIISNIGSFGDGVLKIGMTRRLFPEERVAELGNASVPFPFDIHAMIHAEDAPKLEADFHAEFNDRRVNKVNTRKEFFRVSLEEVRHFLSKEGIEPETVKFTVKADARQYWETQAIDALPSKKKEMELRRLLEKDKADPAYTDDEDIDADVAEEAK